MVTSLSFKGFGGAVVTSPSTTRKLSLRDGVAQSADSDDAIRVALKKPSRPERVKSFEQAADVGEIESDIGKPPENGAVLLLRDIRDVVSRLKKLEKTRGEGLLKDSQLEAYAKEKTALTQELDKIRKSDNFQSLQKGVSLAEDSINIGRTDSAVDKLKAYSGLFGKSFLTAVEKGNVEGISQVGQTLRSISELEVSGNLSVSTLDGLEKSIDEAIKFFAGDRPQEDEADYDPKKQITLTVNGVKSGVDVVSKDELTQQLVKQIDAKPKEALQSIGDLSGSSVLSLLYGESDPLSEQ